jgi:hypothetical protein
MFNQLNISEENSLFKAESDAYNTEPVSEDEGDEDNESFDNFVRNMRKYDKLKKEHERRQDVNRKRKEDRKLKKDNKLKDNESSPPRTLLEKHMDTYIQDLQNRKGPCNGRLRMLDRINNKHILETNYDWMDSMHVHTVFNLVRDTDNPLETRKTGVSHGIKWVAGISILPNNVSETWIMFI